MGKIKIGLIVLFSIALVGLVLAEMAGANSPLKVNNFDKARGEFVQDELIVKFKGDTRSFRVIKVPEGKVGEKIKEYLKRADVEYAEPNYIAYTQLVPNDPYYKYQWHLDNPEYGGIQMEEAWDVSTGLSVTVAVVDTGIRKGTDLAATCFVSGYDFVNNDKDPTDDNGHGTHVAGTIAQSTNNKLGVAGVAFNACLMPVKVLSANGSGSYANVASGIIYAADNGAKVINLSLGGSATSTALEEAVAYAYGKGAIIVAACGNDNKPNCLYPAAYDDYVIAVGATQYDEEKAPYSSYGSNLDLFAPGGNTNLDQNKDGYGDGVLQQTFRLAGWRISWGYYFFQGTSMAAPHVSGAAALVLANGDATGPDEVRAALQETAEYKEGRDDIYGSYGLVNAYAALSWTAIPPEPECEIDADCDDKVVCTINGCINGLCAYTPNDDFCSEDGWVDTGNTRWIEDTQCTEKEQKEQEHRDYYCHLTLDCQYNITETRWFDTKKERNREDGTSCEDGRFCTINDICQSGKCVAGLVRACDDNNFCTADSCDIASDACINTPITTCASGDGCCPAGCSYETDVDCPTAVICWAGSNQYLYRNNGQAAKFCKCASGIYGYNSYASRVVRATVFQYLDTRDNENWKVVSRASNLPVYSVTCTDRQSYPTNKDYYYPK